MLGGRQRGSSSMCWYVQGRITSYTSPGGCSGCVFRGCDEDVVPRAAEKTDDIGSRAGLIRSRRESGVSVSAELKEKWICDSVIDFLTQLLSRLLHRRNFTPALS